VDFIWVEAKGTNILAMCAACWNCKECKFRADSISFKKNKEYEVIINCLKQDVENKKWTGLYPFSILPWSLIDNYHQATKCMDMQEQRLINYGWLVEFNSQFCNTV
jgi:hypothetical protein